MAFAALANMTALSKRNDDPEGASRPFDRTRDGFVFGEGAGIMVVESAEHALARGATILAEIVGAALTADAYHISAPEPTGRGAAMAMTKAMRQAGLAPDEIDHIVAHGTSTPLNDVTETRAIKARLRRARLQGRRSRRPSRWSGTCSARPARAAAIAAVGAIRDGWIAPTINYREPDPDCDLDYVPERQAPAAGRHGDDQRLRLRRPERRRDLPPLRGLAALSREARPSKASIAARHSSGTGIGRSSL